MESQTCLASVLRHEAQHPPSVQEALPAPGTWLPSATDSAEPSVVRRLHERCTGSRQKLQDVQPYRRLQPGGFTYRSGRLYDRCACTEGAGAGGEYQRSTRATSCRPRARVHKRCVRSLVRVTRYQLAFTQPGKPMQNGFIERFNGSYRRGVLDAWVFMDRQQVREETEPWVTEYNTVRPHESLGDGSPRAFLADRNQTDFLVMSGTH